MEELAAYASEGTITDRSTPTPLDPQPSNVPLDSVAPVGQIAREQDVATDYNDSNSNASEASDSDELDDSGDEDYTPESQVCSNDDEPLTAESEGSGAEDAEDMDHDLQQEVSSIIQGDKCDNRCVEGKAKELESLLCSLSTMNREEKQISIYTLLGTLMQVPVDRARGYGLRDKFNYYLPFVDKSTCGRQDPPDCLRRQLLGPKQEQLCHKALVGAGRHGAAESRRLQVLCKGPYKELVRPRVRPHQKAYRQYRLLDGAACSRRGEGSCVKLRDGSHPTWKRAVQDVQRGVDGVIQATGWNTTIPNIFYGLVRVGGGFLPKRT